MDNTQTHYHMTWHGATCQRVRSEPAAQLDIIPALAHVSDTCRKLFELNRQPHRGSVTCDSPLRRSPDFGVECEAMIKRSGRPLTDEYQPVTS